MRTFLLVLSLAPGALWAASAQQFQLETKIFIDGQLVSSPRLVVMSGETSEIAQISEKPYSKMAMKVLATDLGGYGDASDVMMSFDLEYVNQEGRHVRTSPRILARAGEPASIQVEGNRAKLSPRR